MRSILAPVNVKTCDDYRYKHGSSLCMLAFFDKQKAADAKAGSCKSGSFY